MLSVKRFGIENQELYSLSLEIRRTVFIKEQKVPFDIEVENEEEANYLLLFLDKLPIATARWRITKKGIKLERFAMLKEYRNKGYGSTLLQAVLEDVKSLNKPVFLHSQAAAVNYYARHGFKIKGAVFVEADIDHFLMIFDKSI